MVFLARAARACSWARSAAATRSRQVFAAGSAGACAIRARKAAAASGHFFSAKSFSALRTRSSKGMACLLSRGVFLSAGASAWAAYPDGAARAGSWDFARSAEPAIGIPAVRSNRCSRSATAFAFLAGGGSVGADAATEATGAGAAAMGACAGRGGGGSAQRTDEPAPSAISPLRGWD